MCISDMIVADMSVYIAGPMRGIPYYNFRAFDEASEFLNRCGADPVNPADIDRRNGFNPFELPDDSDWSQVPECFQLIDVAIRDIEALGKCDAIYMLDGWENSKGATAEKAFAEWTGKYIVFQTPVAKTPPSESVMVVDKDTGCHKESSMARFDLIPPEFLWELACHYGANCKEHGGKYDAKNWELGGKWSLFYAALNRHLNKFWRGMEIDQDSPGQRQKHIIAVAWHAIALWMYSTNQIGTDDRPKHQ